MAKISGLEEKIDKILSMLLNKGYVIIGKDDINKEVVDYIVINQEVILKEYIEQARKIYNPKSSLEYDFFEREYNIVLERLELDKSKFEPEMYMNMDEERVHERTQKTFENIDILFNSRKKTLKQVLEMYGVDENNDEFEG